MNRTRWAALATVVAVLLAGGGAYALTTSSTSSRAVASPSSTTTVETTSTSEPETTTSTEPPTTTTTAAPSAPAGLARGASGEAVAALQRRLTELRFDPGPADGAFGVGTMYAVQAFQKLHDMAPTGVADDAVQAALAAPRTPEPLIPDGGAERVEVDLRRQLLFLYDGGALRLITHVSTGSGERYCAKGGCGVADTPAGAYRFSWRYSGWRQSRLGKLYNPVYFTSDGIAVHGALSVPTHPASHGCVRIPMHIAEYFPRLVDRGDPVYVLDGTTPVGPAPTTADEGPPPDDPPTTPQDDGSTTTSTTSTTAPPEPGSTTTTSTTSPSGSGSSSSSSSTTSTSSTIPGT